MSDGELANKIGSLILKAIHESLPDAKPEVRWRVGRNVFIGAAEHLQRHELKPE